ncbi:MAG: hypothetical protein Q9225_000143 [Loekoesia sp. 1 TL-2023]
MSKEFYLQNHGSLEFNRDRFTIDELNKFLDEGRDVVDLSYSKKTNNNEANAVDASTISSLDSTDDESEHDQQSGLIKNIAASIQGLMDLSPAIEDNLIHLEQSFQDVKIPALHAFNDPEPASTYISIVCEKFPKAPARLVERLIEANLQRHVLIRNGMTAGDESSEAISLVDDKYRKSHSSFFGSGIGTSISAERGSAASVASHSSFASSMAEKDDESLRVPPTPDEVGSGKPFQCFLCQVVQERIKNRADWKYAYIRTLRLAKSANRDRMHVFADLRPYICTNSGCSDELLRFPSQDSWAQHFDQHRVEYVWECTECGKDYFDPEQWKTHYHERTLSHSRPELAREVAPICQYKPIEQEVCPLCLDCPGKDRRSFIRHVCRHMEDIALLVITQGSEVESDEGPETGSSSTERSLDTFPEPRPTTQKAKLDSNLDAEQISDPDELANVFVKPHDKMPEGFYVRCEVLHTYPQDGEIRYIIRALTSRKTLYDASGTEIIPISYAGRKLVPIPIWETVLAPYLKQIAFYGAIIKRPTTMGYFLEYKKYHRATGEVEGRFVLNQRITSRGQLEQPVEKEAEGHQTGPSVSSNLMSHVSPAKPVAVQTSPAPVPKEEEDLIIKCICGSDDDEANIVVCKHCKTWQHTECYYSGIAEDLDFDKIKHYCADCKPKQVNPESVTERQTKLYEQSNLGEQRKALERKFDKLAEVGSYASAAPWYPFEC